jgi:hypothetical protein
MMLAFALFSKFGNRFEFEFVTLFDKHNIHAG